MSSLDPKDPPRPSRIIVPGQELAPPAAPDASTDAPRIVLPPGVRLDEDGAEDLPEYPRLRQLELVPVRDGDRDLLIVNDPLGVMPAPVALRLESLDLLRLLDGRLSLKDLTAEVVRGSKDVRAGGFVRDFIGQLDRMLMLESPRFDAAYDEMRDAWHRLEIRQAVLSGISYPDDPAELRGFLEAQFVQAEQWRDAAGEPIAAPDALPRALLVPHLDPRRAGSILARGLLELGPAPPEPLRVIVYGVGHSLMGERFALTRKHFETPLGRFECDHAFVDALAARLGDGAYRAEMAHRDEHSIEFAAVYVKHRLGGRRVTLVPILVGGFHALLDEGKGATEDPEMTALIAAIGECERQLGGRTVHLAAVDLSHVGPRFGDPAPDARVLAELEARDRASVEAARRGDADGWYRSIAEHEDSTRICGWGATYAMLRCASPGEGRLLRYEQSTETGGSLVSVAAVGWP